ncbi:MAG TPA: YkgJ family cysteine cluster protein [Acidimicrobiales bacterium]|nr:YkgJ family cysteine cluster protein [Acidimicrobiales bacterium]
MAESADDLLGAARSLVDAASAAFIADADIGVSCTAGCSACCSQAVPVTAAEVRSAVAAIARLPEERRAEIARRAAAVTATLADAGISPTTFRDAGDDPAARRAVAGAYFAQDQPCPLLHDGVCSIRADRPLACREYLVVSDPAHCAPPGVGDEPGDQVVRIRSRNDVRRGFADVSTAFGEPGHEVLAFALADALRHGPPVAPPADPRSGPGTAAMLTPPLG